MGGGPQPIFFLTFFFFSTCRFCSFSPLLAPHRNFPFFFQFSPRIPSLSEVENTVSTSVTRSPLSSSVFFFLNALDFFLPFWESCTSYPSKILFPPHFELYERSFFPRFFSRLTKKLFFAFFHPWFHDTIQCFPPQFLCFFLIAHFLFNDRRPPFFPGISLFIPFFHQICLHLRDF